MNNAWSYLYFRYGEEIGAPTSEDLKAAAHELFHEDIPGMAEGDYAEHGAAHLRYGFDAGPMYVLEIDRKGRARFEAWKDQDYEVEASPPRSIESVTEEKAVELWSNLVAGELSKVEAAFDANF